MTAGPVNRALLESFFQQPGQIYDDTKTESSFDVIADQIDDNYGQVTSLSNTVSNLINTGVLSPYLSNMQSQALINGNFDVWQRGASFTNPTTYTSDRWVHANNPDGGVLPTTIHSRQALTPGDIPNSYYFYRANVNGPGSGFGVNSNYLNEQRIENGTRYLCGTGKQFTLSFWARSSIANKKLAINLTQEYGTGGAPSAVEQLIGNTITLTSAWTKYTMVFTTNPLTGKVFGSNNDDIVRVRFWYMWGNTFISRFNASGPETFVGAGDIDIAQVQLNAGNSALPFQPRSFAEELALCQRYYEKSFPYATAPAQNVGSLSGAASQTAYAFGSQSGSASVPFKTQKRIAPTVTTYNPFAANAFWRNSANTTSTGGASAVNINDAGMTILATSQPANDLYYIHWTADAEL